MKFIGGYAQGRPVPEEWQSHHILYAGPVLTLPSAAYDERFGSGPGPQNMSAYARRDWCGTPAMVLVGMGEVEFDQKMRRLMPRDHLSVPAGTPTTAAPAPSRSLPPIPATDAAPSMDIPTLGSVKRK